MSKKSSRLTYPSVTQVIGFTNQGAYEGIPVWMLEMAAARGIEFHALAQAHALGLWHPDPSPEVQGYFDSFRRWFDATIVKVVLVEEQLFHEIWEYHGTPDLVGQVRGDDGLVLCDWKTPITKSRGWRLQLSSYRELGRANGIENIVRVATVQPRRDGKRAIFNDADYQGFRNDFNVFLAALIVWKFYNQQP
jgi:hypothetical protein